MSQISAVPAVSRGTKEVHRWRAFAVLAVAFFMTVADLAIVNVALTGGFQWAFWACGLIGLAAVPVTFLLVRRNELARAVASTTVKEPKAAVARSSLG